MRMADFSFGAASQPRVMPAWAGGINLLPHRQRNARRARRRRIAEWLAAALAGCVAVCAFAVWQTTERARLDAQRAAAERSLAQLAAPLAEHARLARDVTQARVRAARADALSEPLTRLVSLFDALSHEAGETVVMQQLRHREHETELLATARDHASSAAWIKRLNAIHGVRDAEVSDLRRAANPPPRMAQSESDAIEFTARLRWDGARDPAQRKLAAAAARPVQPGNPRGAK
jgi:Tfp pilus assembly protein PilN